MASRDGCPAGWPGHLLLLYRNEAQRRSGVVAWVRHCLDRDAKVLYIEPAIELPLRSARHLLSEDDAARRALNAGRIEVLTAEAGMYQDGWLAQQVETALAEGFAGVGWSGMAETADMVIGREEHAGIEARTDEVCTTMPVSLLCQYSAHTPTTSLQEVCAAHSGGLSEPLFHARPIESGLALFGEIDASNENVLAALLLGRTSRKGSDTFVLDLGGLDFIDVKATRTLLAATDPFRRDGGRVRLQLGSGPVERLLRLAAGERTSGLFLGEP